MTDRLSLAWQRVINFFIGRSAVKTVDACGLYWGVVASVSGGKVDVTLDSPDVASPSGVPLFFGLPSTIATGIEGTRVLVGFRNGDPSQPFAFAFEAQSAATTITVGNSSPQPAARKGDDLSASSALSTWAGQVETAITNLGGVPPSPVFSATAGAAGGLGTVHGGSGTVKIGG